jgi:signal transduction histidine kinase
LTATPRRSPRQLALAVAVLIVAAVQAQDLVQALRSQARFSTRAQNEVREALMAAAPRIDLAIRTGDTASWQLAALEALKSARASEVEIFDASGTRLFAYPALSPVKHWPNGEEIQKLTSGEIVSVGPISGGGWRILSYLRFTSGDRLVFLRASTAVPELVEDMQERRQLLAIHGIALIALLLAGVLVLYPAIRSETGTGALQAYETAMERLRERGERATLQHEAERRRLEQHIEDRDALARAGELTAGIVHEVRNGLATILGYARLLERAEEQAAVADAARHIREECETLESVVRRFMDFVRRETLDRSPFDLARMLARVAAREAQGRPGVEVTLDMPDADRFLGDEGLLERAFENVVRNACEAAGPRGHVAVRLYADGPERVVAVRDDGPGLSREQLEQLRPFFSTKAGGLGLGLAIALKIVRLHDGVVEFATPSQGGTEVAIRLPAGESPTGPQATARVHHRASVVTDGNGPTQPG